MTPAPINKCGVDGCDRSAYSRGWCRTHHGRWKAGKSMGMGAIRPSRETIGETRLKHGHNSKAGPSPTYRSWFNMLTRCRNPNVKAYLRYGACGITVCDRWQTFENFLSDMGERPSLEHSIDRYPNGLGSYEPGNCRWATRSAQCRNRKSSRPVVRSDGACFPTMIDAAEATPGANRKCIRDTCIGRQKSHVGYGWRFAQ